MTSLALLTFSRDDVDGVLRNVRALRPFVNEVVVVDSSSPSARAKLTAELLPPSERVIPVVALGNADVFRPYGLAHTTQERVLSLDSDEEPSEALLGQLPHLTNYDAYIIPRYETGPRGFTHHLRLFRRRSVRYSGPSYAFPEVRGTTIVLPRSLHIIHHVPSGAKYWNEAGRGRRYFLSDSLERPYTSRYFRSLWGLKAGQKTAPTRLRQVHWVEREIPLSVPAIRLAILLESVRDFLLSGSPGLASFRWQYGLRRSEIWNSLPASKRLWYLAIAKEVMTAGGLTHFLGFDDAAYVSSLTALAPASLAGPPLLDALVRFRADTGRRWKGGPLAVG